MRSKYFGKIAAFLVLFLADGRGILHANSASGSFTAPTTQNHYTTIFTNFGTNYTGTVQVTLSQNSNPNSNLEIDLWDRTLGNYVKSSQSGTLSYAVSASRSFDVDVYLLSPSTPTAGTFTGSLSYPYDGTSPSVSLTTPGSWVTNSYTFNLGWSASVGESGLSGVQLYSRVSGSTTWSTLGQAQSTSSGTMAVVVNGDYTFDFKATVTNNAGASVNSSVETVGFQLNNPTISGIQPANKFYLTIDFCFNTGLLHKP